MKTKTIGKNRQKYIDAIFDRPTACKWFTPNAVNRDNYCRDVSSSFARREYEKAMQYAKIIDHINGRYFIEITQDSWFEITNKAAFWQFHGGPK